MQELKKIGELEENETIKLDKLPKINVNNCFKVILLSVDKNNKAIFCKTITKHCKNKSLIDAAKIFDDFQTPFSFSEFTKEEALKFQTDLEKINCTAAVVPITN